MNPIPFRRFSALVLAGCFLGSVTTTGAKSPPAVQTRDVGTYRLEVAAAKNWEVETKPDQGYVLFYYSDKPAMTENATIGLFRILVPAAARTADRATLAAAYATNDLSGAQQALFKSNAQLMRMSKKTKSINGGELFSFGEPKDAQDVRISSSKFIRGWVFFPKTYAADGALFLLLGKEEMGYNEVRPTELERAEEIVAGIRDR